MANESKVDQVSYDASRPTRWFDGKRQCHPHLVGDYCAIRLQRYFPDATAQLSVDSSASVDKMFWVNFNCTPADFRVNPVGANLQSALYKNYQLFRIRAIKITLVPYGVEPHTNAVRLETVAMFPSEVINAATAAVYDPGAVGEYQRWRDLSEADEYITKMAKTNDKTLELCFVPQTLNSNIVAGNWQYDVMQMPWLPTNAASTAVTLYTPWIGWRQPSTPNPQEIARYAVYYDCIMEFKEVRGNATD